MRPRIKNETKEKLDIYHQHLLLWQKTINLISPNTVDDAWARHFEDSLQLLRFIPDKTKTVWDLGSGAGFPGMVVALARPDITVYLIESDARKCAFLRTVSRETHTGNVSVKNDRLEKLPDILPPPDAITARAFAPLEKILAMTQAVWEQTPDLVFILPKGRNVEAEIKEAQKQFTFLFTKATSAIDPHSCILTVSNLARI